MPLQESYTLIAGPVKLAGIYIGLAVCGYTLFLSLITHMRSESCPAAIRGSIIGVSVFFRVTAVITMAISGVLFLFMPVGQVCFVLAVPFQLLASEYSKQKETKGISMEEIETMFN